MSVFIDLFDFIFEPLEILLAHIGITDQTLSIGFGSIQWFNLEIVLLIKLILSIIIVWVFIKFIYKLILRFVNMIVGWLN